VLRSKLANENCVERAAVDILQDSPHKDQEGQADRSLLQSCGKGVQSKIQICRDCGLDKVRHKHIALEKAAKTQFSLVLTQLLAVRTPI